MCLVFMIFVLTIFVHLKSEEFCLNHLSLQKDTSTYTNISIYLFGFDHILTLPNCGASCFTFGIAKKLATM
jgi:hypothetical protein